MMDDRYAATTTPVSCYYSPSGWAFQAKGGACTCRPCTKEGVPLPAKVVRRNDRRIQRIVEKEIG